MSAKAGSDIGATAVEHSQGPDRGSGLGGDGIARVDGAGGLVQVLQDMDEFDHDADLGAASGDFCLDRLELSDGVVHEHDPDARLFGVAVAVDASHPITHIPADYLSTGLDSYGRGARGRIRRVDWGYA